PGVDVELLRTSLTTINLAAGFVLSGALAWLIGTAPGQRWFHLDGSGPAWLFAAWPMSLVLLRYAQARMSGAAFQRVLGAVLVHGAALFAVLGAASRDELGPGWGLFLLLPPCWGHLFPNNRALALAILLVAPIERYLFAPEPSARSIGYAAIAGVVVAGAYWVFSHRRLRTRERMRRELARCTLGAASADDAAALLAAMRLHDGLSGLLTLACARAASGEDAETLAAARSFAPHARSMIATFGRTGDVALDLGAFLQDFATRVDLALEVDLRGDRTREGPGDLREILVELLANQARHGAGGSAKLSIRFKRGWVTASLCGQRGPTKGAAGRGLRNVALRAEAAGGRMREERRDGAIVTLLELPVESASWRRSLLVIEGLVHLGAPVSAWLCGGDAPVVALIAAVSVVLAAVQIAAALRIGADRIRAEAAVRAGIEGASGPARELVATELGGAIDRLEDAAARGAADAARASLRALAEVVEDLLFALEAVADTNGSVASLADFARVLDVPAEMLPRGPLDAYRARRTLRARAAASAEETSA
ncbi:MAG TPA: hypothetical protein VL400_09315, partial [Polyangiaceae bacterium]|nr:hypothetical protein [Polyangiaceae bacterium]